MDAITIALIVILIGAILIIVEALSPGVFMIIPGTALVIIGIIGYIYPDFLLSVWSPIIALLICVPVTIITVKAYQLLGKPIPPTTLVSDSMIGMVGIVITTVEPGNLKGKVKLGSDIWSATSDCTIDVGSKVKVMSTEGVHVNVAKT